VVEILKPFRKPCDWRGSVHSTSSTPGLAYAVHTLYLTHLTLYNPSYSMDSKAVTGMC